MMAVRKKLFMHVILLEQMVEGYLTIKKESSVGFVLRAGRFCWSSSENYTYRMIYVIILSTE